MEGVKRQKRDVWFGLGRWEKGKVRLVKGVGREKNLGWKNKDGRLS